MLKAQYRALVITEGGVVEEGRCIGCWWQLPSRTNHAEPVPHVVVFTEVPGTTSLFGLCPSCLGGLADLAQLVPRS